MNYTRNFDWHLHTSASGRYEWDHIHASLLMDIRAELQKLNAVFACQNFLDVPNLLRAINKNTRKPKKRKAARK